MLKTARRMLATAALMASALSAQAQATEPGIELAFMASTINRPAADEGEKMSPST